MTVSTALERPKQGSVPASLVGAPALTLSAREFAADTESLKFHRTYYFCAFHT